MKARGFWIVLAGLLLLAVASAGATQVPSPLEVIRSAGDRVMTILNDTPPSSSAEIKRKRRDEIVAIVYEFVDFQEMSRRALARHWKKQSTEKQEEFVPLFEKLLYNTYIDKVDSYTTGTEKVQYDDQVIDGKYALVKARIVGYQDKDIAVDYRLKWINGQWRAYDVVIEGVSFIGNYRSQFNSILSKHSFDSLLDQMRSKIAELEKNNR